MLKLVPGRFYAGVSTWYIKLKYNEVEIRNFVYCTVTQQYDKSSQICRCSTTVIGCCTSGEKWKQVIRFFIEYGTVAMLEERTEQSYARSVTDLSYQNNLHGRCRFLPLKLGFGVVAS